MSRYINADFIEYEPMCRAQGNGMYEDCECAYRDQIDDIPTADVRENVRGEWNGYNADNPEWLRDDGSPVFLTCSECHGTVVNNRSAHWNFCPNCGAQMMKGGDA